MLLQMDGSISKIPGRPIDVLVAPENLSDLETLFSIYRIKYNIKDSNVQRYV